jgi:hypothetical protein
MHEDGVDDPLLGHLVSEFGSFGRDAVEFLVTAETLLDGGGRRGPRLGEAAAYCTREALKRLLDSVETPQAGTWRRTSRAVVEAKRRYLIARELPGEDGVGALEELLRVVDDLDAAHREERIHERRLIAVLMARTGSLPLTSPSNPIDEYQTLIEELNHVVHNHGALDEARAAFERAVRLLRQLFLPADVRLSQLESLAAIEEPSASDAARVLDLVSTPMHLNHFFRHITSPAWLDLFDHTEVLAPPEGQARGPSLLPSNPCALTTPCRSASGCYGPTDAGARRPFARGTSDAPPKISVLPAIG